MKKIAASLTAFVMLLSQTLSITNVFADVQFPQNCARLGFSGNPTIADASNVSSVDVQYTNGNVTVSGTSLYASGSEVCVLVTAQSSSATLTTTGNGSYVGKLTINGADVTTFPHVVSNLQVNQFTNVDVDFSIPPVSAPVTYSATSGDPVDRIAINNGEYDFSNNPVSYDYDNSGTVTIEVETFATLNRLIELKINGTDYSSQLANTKTALLGIVGGQTLHYVVNVPYDIAYTITTKTERFTSTDAVMGSFLWSYKDADRTAHNDDYVGHGRLQLISVKYNNQTYTSENIGIPGAPGYIQWGEETDAEGTFGQAMLPTEAEVTVRLMPDPGYQLTSFEINGGVFQAGDYDNIGVYTFTVPGGNFHLGAHFTKVDNAVNADEADAVTSGSIKIGNGEIDNGTVRLDVRNATDISPDTIEGFNENTGDYNLKTILDIKLFNTIYKGKADETWDTQRDELNNEATITLQLDEGVDGNDIVIIHEKHDAEGRIIGYEVIPTVYDPVNHTITFKTSSFSNYAIATRTIASPNTGEITKGGASATAESDILSLLNIVALIGIAAVMSKKFSL